VFEKWFAVEKEDGKVEREIMAADRGLGFSKVWYTRTAILMKHFKHLPDKKIEKKYICFKRSCFVCIH